MSILSRRTPKNTTLGRYSARIITTLLLLFSGYSIILMYARGETL